MYHDFFVTVIRYVYSHRKFRENLLGFLRGFITNKEVSCLTSHNSCLLSPVSHQLSNVSCLLTPVLFNVSCLISPVSRLMSHVSWLTYSVSCLLSPMWVGCTDLSFLSNVLCLCPTPPPPIVELLWVIFYSVDPLTPVKTLVFVTDNDGQKV